MATRIRLFGVLTLALVAADPSFAGWQNTKWGMTEVEVRKAMHDGSVKWDNTNFCEPTTPDSSRFFAHMTYTVGKFTFSGCAEGSKRTGLERVTLDMYPPQPGMALNYISADLESEMLGKYGAPFGRSMESVPTRIVTEWHDRGDRVVLTQGFYNGVWKAIIAYTPLSTANNKGL